MAFLLLGIGIGIVAPAVLLVLSLPSLSQFENEKRGVGLRGSRE
jgi:hypothetical protein